MEQIKRLLASPEIAELVVNLEATRWTGRPPGYPLRTMVGMTLVKSLYVLHVDAHGPAGGRARRHCGRPSGGAPSADACYRFTRKRRQHKAVLDSCIAGVLASLHDELARTRHSARRPAAGDALREGEQGCTPV